MQSGEVKEIVVVFVVLVLLASCAVGYLAWDMYDFFSYGRLHHSGLQTIRSLNERCPPDVASARWHAKVDWLAGAYKNICFSETYTSRQELTSFIDDMELRLSGNVYLSALDWICDRLGDTGEYGRRYMTRHRADFNDFADLRKHP